MPNCSKCGNTYKLTKRKSTVCLDCKRNMDRAWRLKRKEEGNPVISNQVSPEYMAAYQSEYNKKPEVKKRRAEQMKGYRLNLIEHHKAREAVNKAIKKGLMIRLPCEVCGLAKSEAHHDDYSKPLDVRFLCRKHHLEHHAKAEGK
jgi:hypothetical protein